MKLANLTPATSRAAYQIFESLSVTDRHVLKEAGGLASDADLEKLLKKIAVELDASISPEEIDIDAIEQDAKETGVKLERKSKVTESLEVALIAGAPTLLKLLSKLIDWIYSKLALSSEQEQALKKIQAEYKEAVKSGDKATQEKLKDKIYASSLGRLLGKASKGLHHAYVWPIKHLVYGIGWLKDNDYMKEHAEDIAEVLYTISMLGLAGWGIYHALHEIPSVVEAFTNLGLNYHNIATIVIDSIKGGEMTTEITKKVINTVFAKAA